MKNIIHGVLVVVISWLIMGALCAFSFNISHSGSYRILWANPFTCQEVLGIGQ